MRVSLDKRKQKKKVRAVRNALAYALLVGLAATATAVYIATPGLTGGIARLPGRPSGRDIERVAESLFRKGYIVLTGSKGARKAQLTNAGGRIAYFHSLEKKKANPRAWDGNWFMVSFDIPAPQQGARDAFRHKLRELGFVQYHKSLYAHPCDYSSELDFLSAYYEVEHCVLYFYAADLKGETQLRSIFGLK